MPPPKGPETIFPYRGANAANGFAPRLPRARRGSIEVNYDRRAREEKMSARRRLRKLVGDAGRGFVEAVVFEPPRQFLIGYAGAFEFRLTLERLGS